MAEMIANQGYSFMVIHSHSQFIVKAKPKITKIPT
jgi:hypothetical protein